MPPTAKGGGRQRVGSPVRRSPARRSQIDRRLLFGGGILAIVVVIVLVAVSVGGGGEDGPAAAGLSGTETSAALLDGIPQDGSVLGSPDAPVTLIEYGDLQCPFCAEWSTQTLPTIVEEYVRPGDVRIEFRGLTFLDAGLGTTDSDEALRAIVAAGEQGKLWNVLELLYRNQGEEGSGWVTGELLREVGQAVPGLDVDEMLAASESESTATTIEQMAARAEVSRVSGTPSFEAGRSGQQLAIVDVTSLAPDGIRPTLDALLGR